VLFKKKIHIYLFKKQKKKGLSFKLQMNGIIRTLCTLAAAGAKGMENGNGNGKTSTLTKPTRLNLIKKCMNVLNLPAASSATAKRRQWTWNFHRQAAGKSANKKAQFYLLGCAKSVVDKWAKVSFITQKNPKAGGKS